MDKEQAWIGWAGEGQQRGFYSGFRNGCGGAAFQRLQPLIVPEFEDSQPLKADETNHSGNLSIPVWVGGSHQ